MDLDRRRLRRDEPAVPGLARRENLEGRRVNGLGSADKPLLLAQLAADLQLRPSEPAGPGTASGHGGDVGGGARPGLGRRDQPAGARRQLRLGPGLGRRRIRLRHPLLHDRSRGVPGRGRSQVVVGLPDGGSQRRHLPQGRRLGRVGRPARGGHAGNQIAADLRLRRGRFLRESGHPDPACQKLREAPDPDARPRRSPVHHHFQRRRLGQDPQGRPQQVANVPG